MKFKFFLFLTLGSFLVTLIACSDESDASLIDEPDYVFQRSSNDLSISYEMTTQQTIKPTRGTLEDLCAIDIKMTAVPSSTTSVTTTLSPEGELCMTMEQEGTGSSPAEGKGNKGTTTTFCNGVLTHIAEDGTTTTYQTDYDVRFFQSIAQSYYYNEEQQDSAMNIMILEAEKEGATTSIKGNALTIIEKDKEGNMITTVYDMKNHVVISSTTTDPSGKVIDKTVLSYTCKPDGTIVPDYVINYNFKGDMICSDPVYTVEQTTFDNYQISL